MSSKIPRNIYKIAVATLIAVSVLAIFVIKQNAGWFSPRDYYVIDGDTIDLDDYGKIRYIGIDCPERDEQYYEEARDYNAELLALGKIRLEYGSEIRDDYGRLLAYVFVNTDDGDIIFVNEELARAGWATTRYVKPYMKYADSLYEAERDAQKRNVGIWADDK
ncbi:MAG: nuclease [bacterium]|nr:nuclease [bacterium]